MMISLIWQGSIRYCWRQHFYSVRFEGALQPHTKRQLLATIVISC